MYPNMVSASFDKGFWSKENYEQINELLPMPVMPKKGKLSIVDIERENSEEFMEERKQHSAIESAINSLENHGLDICRDHGIDGFKQLEKRSA